MRKIESQEEQFPDRVAQEKAAQEDETQSEQPYLRTTDVDPRIHFDMGGDPEYAKKFEDAFTRKMVNEIGDPSLPKVPPRRKSPAPTPQAAPSTPSVSAPTSDYDALYPQGPEEWQQFSRAMWPHKSDRFHENYVKSRQRDERDSGPGWSESHHPWESAPQNWQQYADWKRQQGQAPQREAADQQQHSDDIANYYRERDEAQQREREQFKSDPANKGKLYQPSPGTWTD
jgi:hypothetical protein